MLGEVGVTHSLQQRLAHLGRGYGRMPYHLFYSCYLGNMAGRTGFNMVMAGISLAVAAIPRLPAIVTVAWPWGTTDDTPPGG